MQIFCKYSGLYFSVPQFSTFGVRTQIIGEHPIFSLSQELLQHQTTAWANGKLNEQERRLLFLALIKSTELIDFRHFATPADGLVQTYMERILRLISWYNDIRSPQLKLPRFVVSRDTYELKEISNWFYAWEQARKDWEERCVRDYTARKMAKGLRESRLDHALTSAMRGKDFNKVLAAWAMEAASVPLALRKLWTSFFLLDGLRIYQTRTVDLEEMLEHFESYLDHYAEHKYAKATLDRCRELLAKNRAGFNYGIGMPLTELAHIDFLNEEKHPFAFIDPIENENNRIIAASAPLNEPTKETYPDKVSYFRAIAAWRIQQRQSLLSVEVQNKRIAAIREMEIDSRVTPEEAAIEADEAEQQVVLTFISTQQNYVAISSNGIEDDDNTFGTKE